MKMTILEPGPMTGNVLSGLSWHDVILPEKPSAEELHLLLDEHFPEARWERVAVLYQGHEADMFVDDKGIAKRLPRNDAATLVYWTNEHIRLLTEESPALQGVTVDELCRMAVIEAAKVLDKLADDTAPTIRGRAVLFDGRVWF